MMRTLGRSAARAGTAVAANNIAIRSRRRERMVRVPPREQDSAPKTAGEGTGGTILVASRGGTMATATGGDGFMREHVHATMGRHGSYANPRRARPDHSRRS